MSHAVRCEGVWDHTCPGDVTDTVPPKGWKEEESWTWGSAPDICEAFSLLPSDTPLAPRPSECGFSPRVEGSQNPNSLVDLAFLHLGALVPLRKEVEVGEEMATRC